MTTEGDALKMVAQLSAQTGVAMADVAAATGRLRNALGVGHKPTPAAEHVLLMRIAYMAGELLPAMRQCGVARQHYAAYTALRDALVELQTMQTAMGPVVGDEEVQADLVALLGDLREPPSGSASS